MISEKTVELNLTMELINWLSYKTRIPHFAIGPTQKQEGAFGFDVAILGGLGVLIQYKRAYVEKGTWSWHLNRTKLRDQHARLQNLEALGYPVYYAFPFFHTPGDVSSSRRQLLRKTFWFKPSQIKPAGGPTGHHEVIFNTSTGSWSVCSKEPTELSGPLHLDVLATDLLRENQNENISGLMKGFNQVVLKRKEGVLRPQCPVEDLEDLLEGTAIVGRDSQYVAQRDVVDVVDLED